MVSDQKIEIIDGKVYLEIKLVLQEPTLSYSKKTYIIANTNGFVPTDLIIEHAGRKECVQVQVHVGFTNFNRP